MLLAPLRWLARNLSTLLLAFILAMIVWVTAVITADPNEEHTYRSVSIEIIGQDPGLLIVGDEPTTVLLTLRAPKSIWDKLNKDPGLVHAWIDLSGLGAGEHVVKVKTRVDTSPIRYVEIDPQEIQLTLEPLAQRQIPVQFIITGDLPLGYKMGDATLDPQVVTVSGPESIVNRAAQARVTLEITGAIESIKRDLNVEILDENDTIVSDITITPKTITVLQPVSLLGGFKNVVVKVVTKGQVAEGYRLTSMSVSPPTVTLFSDNPQLMDNVPGYVETLEVDLSGLKDDVEVNVGLNLPNGVTLVREPGVLVQVGVAAIEGSLTLSVPVEIVGLEPGLTAAISPVTVDVIVAGPLNILDTLKPEDFLIVLDLSGLPPGVYQRAPSINLYPELVRVQTTLPETIEATILLAPTATPTPTVSATVVISPTPTPTATPKP